MTQAEAIGILQFHAIPVDHDGKVRYFLPDFPQPFQLLIATAAQVVNDTVRINQQSASEGKNRPLELVRGIPQSWRRR